MTTPSSLLPVYSRADLSFERGEGVRLFTGDERVYLDFAAGIGVNILGHCHPKIVAALRQQAEKLWHVSNLYRVSGQERVAHKLCELTFADHVFFTNSGVEAIECAIKMARRYYYLHNQPERFRILTFEGAFHGRTLAAIAAGGQKKYLEGFGPKVDGFDQVPFADFEALKKAITPETAAILVEPIQGEGGIRAFTSAQLRELRKIADLHNLLLIFDEIQCGMGRTGKLFAYEWSNITPDIMTIAKGIGGGFPVGACLASAKAASGMTLGVHGTTFGGNPLAMAVAEAVLDIVADKNFLRHVEDVALYTSQKLSCLQDNYPEIIESVRGQGLMLGLKLKIPPADMVNALRDEKLLTVSAGDNVLRLLPPLIITTADVDEACECIERACGKLEKQNQAKNRGKTQGAA
jgi:acetylornithine/N-succinyldiaminopimelate aminotransferase